jgi:RNA polymerase sigma factor (sigma-70 family)
MDLPGMGIFSRDSRIRLNLMDMQVKKGAGDDAGRRGKLAKILQGEPAKLAEWCALADIKKWGISAERFAEELARCAEARFRDEQASVEELHAYVGVLRLADLGLACACADGVAEAWEHFVGIYRGYLRACAGAMLKRSGGAAEAEELADSLFAELYGLSAERRGSLLRYFHGRSGLKTWLRAVLAQRHVDKIRAGRKFEELGDEDGGDGTKRPVAAGVLQAAADPHRAKYLLKFTEALQTALDNLDARDVERLRMYYAEEKKLAEIGRALEEHESSVSRHLEKVRREVRRAVEEILRGGSGAANGDDRSGGMSEAEIALCFEYAAENAPVDLDKLFSRGAARRDEIDGKEMREARRES